MVKDATFCHIGYVTDSIEATAAEYVKAGYEKSQTWDDEIQRTKICFLTRDGMPTIELVEPLNDKSSVNKTLAKTGVAPYHQCFEVPDIDKAFEQMTDDMGFIPLFRPVEAVAFNNRLICYLYKKEIGFVELVSKY